MRKFEFTTLLMFFLFPVWGLAAHNPLLPQPQQINYGSGQLAVRGLTIELTSPAGPEDRFAAQQLAKWLGSRAGAEIPIREVKGNGPAIVLDRTGAVDALPMPGEKPGPDSREAYELKVTPGGVTLRARSSAGIFYGAETLRQLLEGEGERAVLPEVDIHDWPSLAYRGTMVDMSHGPLPTVEEVERQLDFMARWKANQYYFYSEDSIELKGFPLINPEGRFSQEQVREIIAYARQRHIDVVPCLELYGHQHDLFRVERYSELGFIRYGRDFDPRSSSLISVLTDWIDQFSQVFPSSFFHIGFDETGETKELSSNADKLYMNLFLKVSDLVRGHGKTVMVWSDMFAKYPTLIPQIPSGTIIVPWGYEHTVYEPYWKPFATLPIPRFIASGVSIWDQIVPDFDMSFDNIDNFLAAGRAHGVLGIINTVWTDDVMVLMRPAMPGIAYGAIASWQSLPVDRSQFFSNYAELEYPTAMAPQVSSGLRDLSEAESRLAAAVGEETGPQLWDDPFEPDRLSRIHAHLEDIHAARRAAEDAQVQLTQALRIHGSHLALPELLLEARLMDYATMKYLYADQINGFWRQLGKSPNASDLAFYGGEIYSHDHSRIADLLDVIGNLQEPYRVAWLEEYTPYRLQRVMTRFAGELEYWWTVKKRLEYFENHFRTDDTLPPLD
ncbi:MAG TPA: beta-N-acetylhexosaminidase, partial [Terriglobia bacterium]|nr:beta-N-acetylhexosaminidase [Terriglobia bacterium]